MKQNRAREQTDARQERIQRGHDQRQRLSRSKLAELSPRKPAFDPIQYLLNAVEGRVPRLLPIKYTRMSASPFAFFRGAVAIMAADLGRQPHTGLTVQLCGDAHIQNLGSFETPDGRVVFDINDFDETIPGPWEWDVKRMATSIVLAGLESNHRRSGCADASEAFVDSYCRNIGQLADQPVLIAARHLIHRLQKAQPVSAALRQAARANPLELLSKYAERGPNGHARFKKIESSLWRLHGPVRRDVIGALPLYRESLPPERLHLFDFFHPVDVAFKVVGTGSVGLRDHIVLMEGNGPRDPLFLQIKQEVASAYVPYLKGRVYENQGRRVVEAQRRIQPVSDLLLGWTRIGEHDYLVRQLNDHKVSLDLQQLRGEGLESLAEIAGELLARGHARSGDALAIKSYIGSSAKVVSAIAKYAMNYSELTEADFVAFQKAIKSERLKVAA
ncbi:MAG TPA: DUF2252 domain-containing protein [Bryobacteraceae bacterium]|jgi:uncharacterized protein (DUF2252 family)